MNRDQNANSLRQRLKRATAANHDALDRRLSSLDLTDPGDYGRFLQVQYAARAGIEVWFARQGQCVIEPPATTGLLTADLAALGITAPAWRPFAPPAGSDPIGVAWALGGSSLGNRALLARLRRGAPSDWPVAFLSDTQMPAFWSGVKPHLEARSGEAKGALAAAQAVFAHFASAASAVLDRAAA